MSKQEAEFQAETVGELRLRLAALPLDTPLLTTTADRSDYLWQVDSLGVVRRITISREQTIHIRITLPVGV